MGIALEGVRVTGVLRSLTIPAWAFIVLICHGHLRLNSLIGGREEDDLAVGGLGHGLHSFEVSDLHGRSRRQDVGSLSHQLGGFDFGAGSDNLGLSDTLALSSH